MIKIRSLFAACLALVLYPLFALGQDAEIPGPSIIISEIAAYEPSDTEWVEIYNRSGQTVSMEGWKFLEDGVNHGLSEAENAFSLIPDEYAIIANKADTLKQKYPDYSGKVFDSSWSSLREDGEEIGLKDSDGNIIEFFTYPASGTTSLERIDLEASAALPENWAPHPSSNSLGKARETPVQNENPADENTAGTSTEEISEENGTTTPTEQTEQTETQTGSSTETQTVPQNSPPQAIIMIQSGSLTGYEQSTINFDGRASSDPDGDAMTFSWDMGDGTTEQTANPSYHKYINPGTYVVRLTVIDEHGAKSEAQEYVQILHKIISLAPTTPSQPTSQPVPQPASQPAPQKSGQKSPAPAAPKTSTPAAAKTTQSKTSSGSKSAGKPETQFSLEIPGLKNTELKLNGYFIFVPIQTKQTAAKSTAAKSEKTAADTEENEKTSFRNGNLSSNIKITEIFPNPGESNDEEWIEIFNGGSAAVNLGNWTLADSTKKSPFVIPDTAKIPAGAYMVFKKSETKIALNNGGDDVKLSDWNGKTMDDISYDASEKDKSYALISIKKSSDLVASTQNIAGREQNESAWQWVAESTPGQSNPVFEKIQGVVSELIAGGGSGYENSLEITTQNGKSKKVSFSPDVLDPLLAGAVMKKGASVELQVKEEDGAYELDKISNVKSAPEVKEKKNYFFVWLTVILIAATFAINAPMIIRALKSYLNRTKEENSAGDTEIKNDTKIP